jgi:hypothetical protein
MADHRTSTSRSIPKLALLAAACVLATIAGAAPRVVGDEACATYAGDIESFASCDGDRVAGSESDGLNRSEWLSEDRVPPSKRNGVGLYVDAARAYQLRRDHPQLVVLVDIRSRLEVELAGRPALVDLHLPYQEPSFPLAWDRDTSGWKMVQNSAFAAELSSACKPRGADGGIVILLFARARKRARRELALLSYPNVFSVIDGFEGDVAADGRRSLHGWKNAGLPWTARADASLVYGASN